MKTIIGLDKPISGLDGKPLTDLDGKQTKVKEVIANSIARGASQNPMKAMEVAQKVYQSNNKLDLDDADVNLAKEAVEKDQIYNDMAKSGALAVLVNKE